ncbi:MAG TPA: hypothetical protein VKA85_10235 [Candidatus Limnocylindrales bacterium]|nr:hypothetical protein [Candidatus Limnocylindrales bacterium]
MVVSIPPPRCDHGKHEDAALAQQLIVNMRIPPADIFGNMGEVEFDRPTAARLEVQEQRPGFRAKHVARVRFAVQELLDPATFADRSSQASQRGAEKRPVRVGQGRSAVGARNELLSLDNAIGKVRCRKIDRTHPGVEPRERIRVVGRRNRLRHGLVVGPKRDRETVTLVDALLYARLKSTDGATGLPEPLRKVDFELRDLASCMCHSRKDVTGQQAQREPVRILKNDRVVDSQVERCRDGRRRGHRTLDV